MIDIVFKHKFDALLNDFKQGHVFEKCIGVVLSVEYQKRGLPHTRILLFLHDDDISRCADHVNQIFQEQALIIHPNLVELVMSQMTHGPCGPKFPNAHCMRSAKCQKRFPNRWCDQTVLIEGFYPEYARPRIIQI